MTEDASGSFLFETEDENCCSSEQIGDDEEERSEWLEKENNDTEFISFLLGEQPGNENRSGVPLKCFEHQERDLPSKSLGEEYKPSVLGQTPFAQDRNSEKNSEEVCIISDHGLNSQTTGLNSKKLDICKEEQASFEWTEY